MSKAIAFENFSIETLNRIYEYFGINFEVQGGKITGAYIEGNDLKPTRKISLERLQGLLRKHGFSF